MSNEAVYDLHVVSEMTVTTEMTLDDVFLFNTNEEQSAMNLDMSNHQVKDLGLSINTENNRQES